MSGRFSSSTEYQTGQSDQRPWGRWTVVDAGISHTLKRIEVNVGQRLSLQYHNHRSEHWVVVSGKGTVTIGGDIIGVDVGRHIYVPRGTQHRVEACGPDPLVFIEIQLGDHLSEADIIRIEDDYQREPSG